MKELTLKQRLRRIKKKKRLLGKAFGKDMEDQIVNKIKECYEYIRTQYTQKG